MVKEGIESRLADSMETASKWAEGIVVIQEVDGPEHMYSQTLCMSRLSYFFAEN